MGVLTANFVSYPESVQSGQGVALGIERLDDGVRDTTFTGTANITVASGTGMIGGTTVTVNFVLGFATIGTAVINGVGNHTLTATLSSGQSATTGTIVIRPLAYAMVNGYDLLQPIYDAISNKVFWFQMRVPAGANAGTPLPLVFWYHQAGRYQDDYASPALCIAAQRTDSFGQRADAGSVPAFVVYLPIVDKTDAARGAYVRRIHAAVVARLIADGWNIDTRRLYATGFSTGGITWHQSVLCNPTLWAGAALCDGTMVSATMTNYPSFAGELAILGPEYYDAPPSTFSGSVVTYYGDGNPSNDVLMFAEVARVYEQNKVAFLHFTSNDNSTTAYWGRRINDFAPLRAALASRGAITSSSTGTGSVALSVNPTDSYHERYYTDLNHGATLAKCYDAGSWPTVWAWMSDKVRPITAPPYVAPPARPLPAGRPFLLAA